MTIRFQCRYCRRPVIATERTIVGLRGPACGQWTYVPSPDVREIPLVPASEEEERRRQDEIDRLLEMERAIWIEHLQRIPA